MEDIDMQACQTQPVDETARQAEYDSLVNQKSSANAQYVACENQIASYEYTLRRLNRVKEDIVTLKGRFGDNKKLDKSLFKAEHIWQGTQHDTFLFKMELLTTLNDEYHKDFIDHVLDSINNEITRIENKKLAQCGLLGELAKWINNLSNQIENFFN